MAFDFNVGLWGILLLAVGGVVLGIIGQLIGEARFGYEWLVTAIGAFIGGFVASEFIVGWQAFEPVWDGLALVPALIGGLIVGVIVELATRYLTGGTYTAHRPMSA